MPTSFSVAVDLGFVAPSRAAFDAQTFPNLAFAVKSVAERAQSDWAHYAAGAPLPDGRTIHDRTGTYLRSINMTMTGDFSASVFSNAPEAKGIEEGTPARDLKDMLSSSLKVRLAKDGTRYLIIPFRWSIPGAVAGNNMQAAVHKWWSDGDRVNSHITAKSFRRPGTGALDIKTRKPLTVPAWKYSWGTRLSASDMDGMKMGAAAKKRHEGMVRFRNPDPQSAGQNSKYLTFRVMSEKSTGWKVPARPGFWPARTVADAIKPVAEEAFRAAVEEDIRLYVAQMT